MTTETPSISTLTPRQDEILRYLRYHVREYGFPPSVREVAERMGMPVSTVHYQLNWLAEKGFIIRRPTLSRGITLVTEAA